MEEQPLLEVGLNSGSLNHEGYTLPTGGHTQGGALHAYSPPQASEDGSDNAEFEDARSDCSFRSALSAQTSTSFASAHTPATAASWLSGACGGRR